MLDDPTGAGFAHFVQGLEAFFRTLWTIIMAAPRSPADIAQTFAKMWSAQANSAELFGLLALCTILMIAPGLWVRWRPIGGKAQPQTLGYMLLNAGIDLGGAALIATLAAAVLFREEGAFEHFCIAVLWLVVRLRAAIFGLEIFLLPAYPGAALNIGDARRVLRPAALAFALILTFVTIVPVLLDNDLPLDPARGLAFLDSGIASGLGIWALANLTAHVGAGRRWLLAGGILAGIAYWLLWTFSLVELDFSTYDAVSDTIALIWICLVLHRLGVFAARAIPPDRLAAEPNQGAIARMDTPVSQIVLNAVQHCLFAVYVAIGITLIDRLWLVDVMHLTTAEQWPSARRAIVMALVIALAGYFLFVFLRMWSRITFGPERVVAIPGLNDTDNEIATGSRLATLLPLMSRILLTLFFGLAVLAGLSDYGVNIGPILAGAGIFGLAISFGSQALVRDIVSGLFYIFDDAFRVGEYIDTGKQKGTVERISLRSMRLRHQNGQVHTVPYGQLSTVTNFSRDWTTIKFNLRLARDSDIEKVRKAAKRVGLLLQEDPELGREFLGPLKLQGVADVLENALLVRFKFTCLPLRASYCQREAIKRLYDAFTAQGIRFAVNELVVKAEALSSAQSWAEAGVRSVSDEGGSIG
ncbi:mechanosensitive ion channel family protein [Methylovirgula sp. 4M-Z18]|uniref:mechanosensitive ion channel family protein n=1 Tax=Methylovirgula sp. 4M-Z18 TaxID=2293567 RepID=UPI000E2E53FE|nr:mechanosensitive ion channel family protein [Methylovirgula sp. 4M-Z18]RFB78554.1 mechanosensitive ion channel family protein [Methylovirgula sp. 4M-Z18]